MNPNTLEMMDESRKAVFGSAQHERDEESRPSEVEGNIHYYHLQED